MMKFILNDAEIIHYFCKEHKEKDVQQQLWAFSMRPTCLCVEHMKLLISTYYIFSPYCLKSHNKQITFIENI